MSNTIHNGHAGRSHHFHRRDDRAYIDDSNPSREHRRAGLLPAEGDQIIDLRRWEPQRPDRERDLDGGLISNGSDAVDTGRYLITVDEDRVRVFDKETDTWVEAWGDPHLTTGDGDKGQFHENLTLELKDGTKITFKTTPKDANGIARLDSLAVIKGDESVVIKGLSDGKAGAELGNVLTNGRQVDRQFEDGTVLIAGRQVDDLTFASDGTEIVGEDPTQRFNEHVLDGHGGAPEGRCEDRETGRADGRGRTGGAGHQGRSERDERADRAGNHRGGRDDEVDQAGEGRRRGSGRGAGGTSAAESTDDMAVYDPVSEDAADYQGILNRIKDYGQKIDDLIAKLNDPNTPEADIPAITAELQLMSQRLTALTTALSNTLQARHDAEMASIRNLRT